MSSPIPWRIDCAGRTRVFRQSGSSQPDFLIRRSELNEDSSLDKKSAVAQTVTPSVLFAIADGVGETAARNQARRLLLDSIVASSDRLLQLAAYPNRVQRVHRELEQTLGECESLLQRNSTDHDSSSQLAGMLTIGLLSFPRTYIAHVGSARVYHVRSNVIRQVTSDHTMASRLVQAGELTPRRAASSQLRHVIWNVISSKQRTYVEKHTLNVHRGDSLLLCSDAVAVNLFDSEILATLGSNLSTDRMCDRLLAIASRRSEQGEGTAMLARFRTANDTSHFRHETRRQSPSRNNTHTPQAQHSRTSKPRRIDDRKAKTQPTSIDRPPTGTRTMKPSVGKSRRQPRLISKEHNSPRPASFPSIRYAKILVREKERTRD